MWSGLCFVNCFACGEAALPMYACISTFVGAVDCGMSGWGYVRAGLSLGLSVGLGMVLFVGLSVGLFVGVLFVVVFVIVGR